MGAIDANSNGYIEYSEFVDWMYGNHAKLGDISPEMKAAANIVARHIADLECHLSFQDADGNSQEAKASKKVYVKVVDNRLIKVTEATFTNAEGTVETSTTEEEIGNG